MHALHRLVSGLPAGFPAPVLVVLHIGSTQSMLPTILGEIGRSSASFARQNETLRPGHIFIAPPDHHMMICGARILLSQGPRENWARPAIDPLFRSAAQSHGPAVIGIVLTGGLHDGTLGLYEVKQQGGIAMVQSPAEAEAPDMPRSALENVKVDYCLPLAEMPRLLTRLVQDKVEERRAVSGAFAMETEPQPARPAAQTSPECGGAMREETIGEGTRFRCHSGHWRGPDRQHPDVVPPAGSVAE